MPTSLLPNVGGGWEGVRLVDSFAAPCREKHGSPKNAGRAATPCPSPSRV